MFRTEIVQIKNERDTHYRLRLLVSLIPADTFLHTNIVIMLVEQIVQDDTILETLKCGRNNRNCMISK